jgi:glycosyltransferase involved in cell wall biosynthesis
MMKPHIRKIFAWHPVLTDHQAHTYKELARQSGLQVQVIVAKLEDETRRAQGWTDTRLDGIQRQQLPSGSFLRHGIRFLLENRDQIHLFGSAFENSRMLLLLWLATRLGLDCYIISEPYSTVPFGYLVDQPAWRERLKTSLRPCLYRCYILFLRSGLKGIFAISRLAIKQYTEAGMPPNRLFPFGYFVPSEAIDTREPSPLSMSPSQRLRVVFVGSLISRKGLQTLISAVRRANDNGADIQLDVFGPGDPSRFGFDGDLVRYEGRIPFGRTQQYLPGYDVLVLPSNYDGWGVVINEALCVGVPVLCSDQVGARVLVETFGVGLVFPCGDDKALTEQLVALAANSAMLEAIKSACLNSVEAIQPARAAAYMLEVLTAEPQDRSAIPSPWYKNTG